MDNLYRSPVNGFLRKAAVLLESCFDLQEQAGSRLAQEALVEASLFHLHLALVNFLREIAENYQAEDSGHIQEVAELASALNKIDKHPAELAEINTSAEEGWLSELLSSYALLGSGSTRNKALPGVQQAGLIQTRQLSNNELSYARAQTWLDKMRELVERQREMMVEC